MGADTHVRVHHGELVVLFDSYRGIDEFSRVLHGFDGTENFALLLRALPPGMTYKKAAAGGHNHEYLQAAGRADAMTVEICKAGGRQRGADRVRYVVGRRDDRDTPRDVPIALPRSTEMRSASEVFGAGEAAQLFYDYYRTGDIGPG